MGSRWAAAEERRDRIAELTREGMTRAEIAKILGITARTVERGRVARGCARLRREFTEEEIRTAEALLDDGCSYSEVARTLGRALTTVSRHWPGRGWTQAQSAEQCALVRKLAI